MRSASARYYDGPVSDHFDGTRFFDLHGPTPRTFAEQLRWWREGGRAQWPEWAPSPYSDTPPARVTSDDWRVGTPARSRCSPNPSTVGGDDDWRFTWAVMAGISYAINQNLALDLGYRFLDIQDGKAVRTVLPTGGTIDYKDLYSQEVRLGFRWLVD